MYKVDLDVVRKTIDTLSENAKIPVEERQYGVEGVAGQHFLRLLYEEHAKRTGHRPDDVTYGIMIFVTNQRVPDMSDKVIANVDRIIDVITSPPVLNTVIGVSLGVLAYRGTIRVPASVIAHYLGKGLGGEMLSNLSAITPGDGPKSSGD